ncbi:MAG: exodeoxyribonuclease VII small subunit [Trebonia sp.]
MTDRDALSYEQARDELTSVVKRLEAGGLSLEQSLDLWERGERLAAICAEWLEGARARLSAAMAARDGAADGDAEPSAGSAGGLGNSEPDAKAPF